MSRGLIVTARVLVVLLLLSGIVLLLVPYGMQKALSNIDSRYLPCQASLQAHAERLATHFVNRLMTPPLPVLPDSIDVPFDELHYPEQGLPPQLASSDLPQRFGVSWTRTQGWTCAPPQTNEMFLSRMFGRMANRPGHSTPTMTMITMDPPERDNPMILAGTWIVSDDDAAFSGALTPLDAFYNDYAPRWFDEYCKTTFGQTLKSWIWQPTEFRLIPQDRERAPLILRPSQPLPAEGPDDGDILTAYSPDAATLMANLAGNFEDKEGWQANAEWFETSLFPLRDDVEVATPLRVDTYLAERGLMFIRYAIAAIAMALILMPFAWARSKT